MFQNRCEGLDSALPVLWIGLNLVVGHVNDEDENVRHACSSITKDEIVEFKDGGNFLEDDGATPQHSSNGKRAKNGICERQ